MTGSPMARSRAARVARLAVVVFVSSRKGISRAARSSSNSLAPGTGRDETWSTPSTSKSHPRTGANGEGVILRVNTVYATGVACASPAVAPPPQPSGVAHMPGPPGALGAFIWLWQQTNPLEHEPSTPAVHPQPTPVQGVPQWLSAPQ